MTLWDAGAADTEKSGGGVTDKVTAAVWTRAPLVPVIVSAYVPGGVVRLAVTVIAVVPDPVSVGGAKLAAAPVGRPLTVKAIVPENPFAGVAVTE